jgi:ferredoxin
MSEILVDTSLCRKDGVCAAVCGARAVRVGANGFPEEVPGGSCIQCGHCVAICISGALSHTGLPQEALFPVPKELPSAAQVDNLLMSRRAVREFKEQPVARETLEAMLDVARRAPSAKNNQKVHWIVVIRRRCAPCLKRS